MDATKNRKARWEKVNQKPLTKESALSLAAQQVDNTISARGKIIKTKPKIVKGKEIKEEVVETGDEYFKINKFKFRDYQQKQGAKSKLPNSFIERQKYRADSRGEVTKLKRTKQFSLRNAFGI
jgi:hypothetical protein